MNPEEHPMSRDMEQVVTIHMIHGTETLKKEWADDDPPWRQLMHLSQVGNQQWTDSFIP